MMTDMKKMIAMIKHMLMITMMLCCTTVLPSMALTPSVASAHLLSCAQERGIGAKVYNKANKGHDVRVAEDGSAVACIQDRLVQYNPERLNMKDGKHKRWIARTEVDYSATYPNAFMAPGGYNVIYEKEIEMGRTYDKYDKIQQDPVRPLDVANYSARSNVAATLAHEYGHWANADFLRMADRHIALSVALAAIPVPGAAAVAASVGAQAANVMVIRQETFAAEAGADEAALEFLDNVPDYSMGSVLSNFHRDQKYMRSHNMKEGGGFQNFLYAHSHTDTRMERARDYIKKVSKDCVDIDEDFRLRVDGTLVNGTGRLMDADRADGKERTAFLAGQIASCIKRGVWKPEHLTTMTEKAYTRGYGSEDRTVLVACQEAGKAEGHGLIVKVLGTFDYPMKRAKNLLTAAQKKAAAEFQAVWDLTRSFHARVVQGGK